MHPDVLYLEWCGSNKETVQEVDRWTHTVDNCGIIIYFKDGSCMEYPPKNDPVNHPSHYKSKAGIETIDVIDAFTADLTGTEAVCTANVIKYICRWKNKNGLQDLEKAKWYLEHLINHIKKENDQL